MTVTTYATEADALNAPFDETACPWYMTDRVAEALCLYEDRKVAEFEALAAEFTADERRQFADSVGPIDRKLDREDDRKREAAREAAREQGARAARNAARAWADGSHRIEGAILARQGY